MQEDDPMRIAAFFLWIGFMGNLMAPPAPDEGPAEENRVLHGTHSFTEKYLDKSVAPMLECDYAIKCIDEGRIVLNRLDGIQKGIDKIKAEDPSTILTISDSLLEKITKRLGWTSRIINMGQVSLSLTIDKISCQKQITKEDINTLNKDAFDFSKAVLEQGKWVKDTQPVVDTLKLVVDRLKPRHDTEGASYAHLQHPLPS